MRSTVEAIWLAYSEDLEGRCTWLYCDVRGLVTTAIGNLVDTPERALALPWIMPSGELAHESQVRLDWSAVKNYGKRIIASNLSMGTAVMQKRMTIVRLGQKSIDQLVMRQLRANAAYLRKLLSNWDTAPSDAQLATLSLAWAVGAGLDQVRPRFVQAFLAEDWLVAASEALLSVKNNAGVAARNVKQTLCFENAALVKTRGEDPALLYWPGSAKLSPEEEIRRAALAAADPLLASGPSRNS
jgi:hypothetical protein